MGSPKRDAKANHEMEMAYAWQLMKLVNVLPSKDKSFVVSMLIQFDKKGKLTEKQWYWVGAKLRAAYTYGASKGYVHLSTDPEAASYEVVKEPEPHPAFSSPSSLVKYAETVQPEHLAVAPAPKPHSFIGIDYAAAEKSLMATFKIDAELLKGKPDKWPSAATKAKAYAEAYGGDVFYPKVKPWMLEVKLPLYNLMVEDLSFWSNPNEIVWVNNKLKAMGHQLKVEVDKDIKEQQLILVWEGSKAELNIVDKAFHSVAHGYLASLMMAMDKAKPLYGAVTGKLKSYSPMIQQIPKKSVPWTKQPWDIIHQGFPVNVESDDYMLEAITGLQKKISGKKTYSFEMQVPIGALTNSQYHEFGEMLHLVQETLENQSGPEYVKMEAEVNPPFEATMKFEGSQIIYEVSKLAYHYLHANFVPGDFLKFLKKALNHKNVAHNFHIQATAPSLEDIEKVQLTINTMPNISKAFSEAAKAIAPLATQMVDVVSLLKKPLSKKEQSTLDKMAAEFKKLASEYKVEFAKTPLLNGPK